MPEAVLIRRHLLFKLASPMRHVMVLAVLLGGLACALFLPLSASAAPDGLLPRPVQVTVKAGWFTVPRVLTYSTSRTRSGVEDPRLLRAIERFGVEFPGKNLALKADLQGAGRLHVEVREEITPYPQYGDDESYTLSVTTSGILIDARTTWGAMQALQTLYQLVEVPAAGEARVIPVVAIRDAPRFSWRGMLLDTVRHWMPPDAVKRMLDSMSLVKLNVLHLHLTDDQGFRMASKSYPRLQSPKHYTYPQMQELIEYAADRGIRIVPEFGLPGHSKSWQAAYPELAVQDAQHGSGLKDIMFSAPIDPVSDYSLTFINSLVEEMSVLFVDEYWHIGGDEVNPGVWDDSASLSEFMRQQALADAHDLQAWFSTRYIDIVESHGKTAIGWDEILHPGLSSSAIVHAWREGQTLDLGQRKVLVSAGYYLDQQYPAELMYRHDPTHVLPVGAQSSDAQVMGAEIANWSETIDKRTVDIRTWPRAAAVAELLWSSRAQALQTSAEDLYRRLAVIDRHLEARGSRHHQVSENKLRRLAGEGNAEALLTLASVSEPTPYAMIQHARSWPFVRDVISAWWDDDMAGLGRDMFKVEEFGELIPGESVTALEFGWAVDDYLATAAGAQSLREQLSLWAANHESLEPTITAQKILRDHDVLALSHGLTELSATGIACLDALEGVAKKDNKRLRSSEKVLERYAFEYRIPSLEGLAGLQWMLNFQPHGLREHRLAIQPAVAKLCGAL